MILDLDEVAQHRLENGLNGWAQYEGHLIINGETEARIEALIKRDTRRAKQHMQQVRALMNGADPKDKELLKSLKT